MPGQIDQREQEVASFFSEFVGMATVERSFGDGLRTLERRGLRRDPPSA